MALTRRGFTLTELVVYGGLSFVVLAVLLSVFVVARRTQQQAYTSSLVGGRTYSAMEVLRRDLQSTALATIEVYPNEGNSSEAPGCSMAYAYAVEGDDEGQMSINTYGAPLWQGSVFYTVQKQRGQKVGSLVRWEKKKASQDFLPSLTTIMPSQIELANSRVLVEDVMLPGQTIEGVGDEGQYESGEAGGFQVEFVRRSGGEDGDESLTNVNPRDGDPADNTRLVQVTLKILRDEDTSRPSLYVLKLRATPRY